LNIHHFFSTIGDKVARVLFFNPLLENIVVIKVAIILIALALIISSLALLVQAIPQCRQDRQNSLMLDFNTSLTDDQMQVTDRQ